ncbi:unnamed protein product [Phytomonas sp. Hart1]|nr:unnamed protein product [Phytomonas sp. Hart1]|eukprot:CCW71193.1 unnamed protein product [Phytomonas sp. isolate Hart1]
MSENVACVSVDAANSDEEEDDDIVRGVASMSNPVNCALNLHPCWGDSEERLLLRELDYVKEFLIENRHVLSSASLTVSGSNLLEGVFGVPATVFPFLIHARESLSFITSTFECIENHYGPLKYENFATFIKDMFYIDRPDIVRHTPRIFRTLDAKRRGVISFEEFCSWFAKKLSCGSNLDPDAHLITISMTLRLPLALILNLKPLWHGRKCAFESFLDCDVEY